MPSVSVDRAARTAAREAREAAAAAAAPARPHQTRIVHAPPRSGALYVDNSLLADIATCSTRVAIRNVYQLVSQDESAHLMMGSAGHEALALYFKGSKRAEALERFRYVYEDWADANVDPGDDLDYYNVATILKVWMRNHPRAKLPFEIDPELVEVGFSFPLDAAGKYNLVGKQDVIGFDRGDGEPVVVDNKFRANWLSDWWKSQFELSSQGTGYLWAVRQMVEQRSPHIPEEKLALIGSAEEISKFYVNAIQVKKLPSDASRKCRDHSVPYAECREEHVVSAFLGPYFRTPTMMEEWKRSAIHLAKKYEELVDRLGGIGEPINLKRLSKIPKEGQFTGSCTGCFARRFCAAERREVLVESGRFFVHQPWEPFANSGMLGEGKRDHKATGGIGGGRGGRGSGGAAGV